VTGLTGSYGQPQLASGWPAQAAARRTAAQAAARRTAAQAAARRTAAQAGAGSTARPYVTPTFKDR
jgi:hypothetical protein